MGQCRNIASRDGPAEMGQQRWASRDGPAEMMRRSV